MEHFLELLQANLAVAHDPALWNVHGLTERLVARTNNPLQRFNRELNSAFSTPHPSLAVFVTTIEAISREYVATIAAVRGIRARGRRREAIQLPVPVELPNEVEESSTEGDNSEELDLDSDGDTNGNGRVQAGVVHTVWTMKTPCWQLQPSSNGRVTHWHTGDLFSLLHILPYIIISIYSRFYHSGPMSGRTWYCGRIYCLTSASCPTRI